MTLIKAHKTYVYYSLKDNNTPPPPPSQRKNKSKLGGKIVIQVLFSDNACKERIGA